MNPEKDYDDAPSMVCEKKRVGWPIFLWLCPKHVHCQGFHMIAGSEGRTDAHASLYCYAEEAPGNLFCVCVCVCVCLGVCCVGVGVGVGCVCVCVYVCVGMCV